MGLTVSIVGGAKCIQIRGKERRLLDRINVTLPNGKFIGILGPSGSGKSTLIQTFAGLRTLSEGNVEVGGAAYAAEDLHHDPRIAYLPQDVIIHEPLTCRVALSAIAELKQLGSSAEERRTMIEAALKRVSLLERIDVPIIRLSGGQRKRAGLAAELLGDPQLILLDEATSGLDPATEGEMMLLFRQLADEGRTVVCITHFPGRLHLCDRLICLQDGLIILKGRPRRR